MGDETWYDGFKGSFTEHQPYLTISDFYHGLLLVSVHKVNTNPLYSYRRWALYYLQLMSFVDESEAGSYDGIQFWTTVDL